MKICPCSNNICQLRLDFDTFVITGPSTLTDTVGKALMDQIQDGTTGEDVTNAGRCLTDIFSVTSASTAPPAICGTNTGQHSKILQRGQKLFADSCSKLLKMKQFEGSHLRHFSMLWGFFESLFMSVTSTIEYAFI